MKRAYRLIAPVALAALVSACSILPKAEPSDVYRLASAQTTSQATPVTWSLRVNKPQTSEFLDSPRIAVVPNGDLISSYASSRWSDPAPVLLRNRLLDGFQRDGRVTLLSTDDSNFQADLELGGSLQAFQTEYQGTQAGVVRGCWSGHALFLRWVGWISSMARSSLPPSLLASRASSTVTR